ncbi:flagellar basal body P-ring formation chaperone FlgA [Rhodobacter ferrooxidans]|uniref:Flagella basal body P-ring formation protein FlgA n=1 Tax=Rhodobacter ferrooxidans TaxID=371731 RepID=C8RX63_9RHOB|nr:flagellar basal body P-ring formation chaperone FlgA [Rhodobacter sp. SW2]EEW26588.1 flagella basal body P-ring formation protein FlgA [Rhodobacter sp. SW2]
MRFLALILLFPTLAQADSLVATRTIRAQTVLAETDMTLVAADIPGALTDTGAALGLEARTTLYAGRPIRPGDLGAPAIVERNQVVSLAYHAGPLTILTEGRAMARGGVGDVIAVMNLDSRTTVSGRIDAEGMVQVNTNP